MALAKKRCAIRVKVENDESLGPLNKYFKKVAEPLDVEPSHGPPLADLPASPPAAMANLTMPGEECTTTKPAVKGTKMKGTSKKPASAAKAKPAKPAEKAPAADTAEKNESNAGPNQTPQSHEPKPDTTDKSEPQTVESIAVSLDQSLPGSLTALRKLVPKCPYKFDAAEYERFKRSLEPTMSRQARGEKCSEALALQIKATGPTTVASWYRKYVEAGSKFGNLELLVTIAKQEHTGGGGRRQWMNTDQMLKHFRNPAVVESMKKGLKEKDATNQDPSIHYFRCHPDCPELEVAHEFFCLVEEFNDWGNRATNSTNASLEVGMDQAAGAAIVPSFLGLVGGSGVGGHAAPPVPTGETEEQKQERVKREHEKAIKLAEKQRIKELPTSKCKAWADMMQKDEKKGNDLIEECGLGRGVPKPVATTFVKTFRHHTKAMAQMIKDLNAVTPETAETTLEKAKKCVEDFKAEVKKWTSTKRIHS